MHLSTLLTWLTLSLTSATLLASTGASSSASSPSGFLFAPILAALLTLGVATVARRTASAFDAALTAGALAPPQLTVNTTDPRGVEAELSLSLSPLSPATGEDGGADRPASSSGGATWVEAPWAHEHSKKHAPPLGSLLDCVDGDAFGDEMDDA
eukprot:1469480-Prymnesium_polylepis.1